MFRHIAWFNEAPVTPDTNGNLTSPHAGVRRRCLMPARELEVLGIECSVFGNLHNSDGFSVGKHLQKLDTDIVVIGNGNAAELIPLARIAKQMGCYIVADLGEQSEESPGLDELAVLADHVVVASEEDAVALKSRGIASSVIPDCSEDEQGAGTSTALLWLDCFKKLKMKPPVCANTNFPSGANG